jgi:hypothetical protein
MYRDVRPRRAERPPSSRPAVVLAVAFTWLIGLLAASEASLRLLGRRTWQPVDPQKETALHEPAPVFGWVNKPGHYVLPPHLPGGSERAVTILPDHSRATGAGSAGGERVVLVGCSVTAGYGLSDADTFAWKLQQTHPELRIVNYGTAAYGTFQSLLRMEQVLSESPPPRLVLYGFITQHEARNVATYDWLRGLALNAARGHVALPYVTLGPGGRLERHRPESFSVWPLADHLVTVRVAGDAYMHLLTYGRSPQGSEATKHLLLEMAALARSHSTPFAVVFLIAGEGEKQKREYFDFFQENNVPYLDCVQPLTEDNRIPGEGHPNGKLNSVWADCIANRLPDLLAERAIGG